MPCLLLASMLVPASAHAAALDLQMFGVSVAGLGDVDGDGAADFAVGDPSHPIAGDWSGRVWIVSGATWRPLHVLNGGEGEALGFTLAAAGDLDGDGIVDLLIGAAPDSAPARVVAASGKTGERLYDFELPAEDAFKAPWYSSIGGPVMVPLGNSPTEGPVFAVGAPYADIVGKDAGSVQIRRGRDGELLRELHGVRACDRYGIAVAAVGDIDGDGHPDLAAAGVPHVDSRCTEEGCTEDRAGYIQFISGKDGSELRTLRAPDESRAFGLVLHGAARGEDGVLLLVSSWLKECPGKAPSPESAPFLAQLPGSEPRVLGYSAQSGELKGIWRPDRRQWGGRAGQADGDGYCAGSFGFALTSVGDLDGDGNAEVLITAPTALFGSAGIYAGAGYEIVRPLVPHDKSEISHFGVSAAALGDIDGDGHAEFAIGAATMRAGGSIPGVLHVYSAASGALLARLDRARLDAR